MKYNTVISVKDLTTGTVTEPATVEEFKHYARINGFGDEGQDFDADDALIAELITSARESLEKHLRISIVQKTLRATLRNEVGLIEIPQGPVRGVMTVTTGDSETSYTLSGEDFPRIVSPLFNELTITYTAGYESVPKTLKMAILMEVAYRYEHRGDEMDDEGLCKAAIQKAKPFKRGSWLV